MNQELRGVYHYVKSSLSFDEFAASSYGEWRTAAEATLKGAPFEKKLVTRTSEGIDLQPIYNAVDTAGIAQADSFPGFSPFLRGTDPLGYAHSPWEVAQFISYGDVKEFNTAAQHDLAHGQTALRIGLDRASRLGLDPDQASPGDVGLCGLSLATTKDMARLFEGIDLESTPVYIQGGSAALPVLSLLGAVLRSQGKTTTKVCGAVESDPLAELVLEGTLPRPCEDAFDEMALLIRWGAKHAPLLKTIGVSVQPYHDAGGNAVQELAFALATGVEYLRQMEQRGVAVEEAARQIRFTFSIGADFYISIAKLRAARVLWQQLVRACGGSEDAGKILIHARTSLWNKSVLDPYTNMLRVTSEALAAILGSCDSLETGAFDEVVRPPDDFSRRIARNTQVILREECHMDRVVDPAGGSWLFEKLTDELGRKAWALFQEVESKGGMLAALRSGWAQEQVVEVAEKKIQAMEQRRAGMVGVNLYANPSEKFLERGNWKTVELQRKRAASIERYRTIPGQTAQAEVMELLGKILASKGSSDLVELSIEAARQGATLGELSRTLRGDKDSSDSVVRLEPRRAAEPYEELREAVEAYRQKTGARPKLFLAKMGPIRQHKIRADFTAAFFEAGGFEVLPNSGFANVDDATAAATAAEDAKVVVICSTDDTYPEIVPTLAPRIKDAKPDCTLIVAGYPEAHVADFKAAGVDDFIHIRSNCYATLRGILERLEILK